MKSTFYILRKMLGAGGRSMAILSVQVVVLMCICVYALAFPVDSLIRYRAFWGRGLEQTALFSAGFNLDLPPRDDEDEVPASRLLQSAIAEIADIGVVHEETVRLLPPITDRNELTSETADLVQLVTYPRIVLKRIEIETMPPGVLLKNFDIVPLVMDMRAQGVYTIGQRVKLWAYDDGWDASVDAEVVGFIDTGAGYLGRLRSGSLPDLSSVISSNRDIPPLAFTYEHELLPRRAWDSSQTSMFMFAKEGENVADYVEMWDARVASMGWGRVSTFAALLRNEFFSKLFQRRLEDYLLLVWAILLLLLSTQGYIARLVARLEKQMRIYRVWGMSKGRWYVLFTCAFILPTLMSSLIGYAVTITAIGSSLDSTRTAPAMLAIVLMLFVLMQLPSLIVSIVRWSSKSLVERETE